MENFTKLILAQVEKGSISASEGIKAIDAKREDEEIKRIKAIFEHGV